MRDSRGQGEKVNTTEIISKMAFLSYSSTFVKSLTIEEPEGDYRTRGVIHLFLRAETGSVKTTILSEIARNFKVEVVPDITNAGLVGTIDKNMNVIPGACWQFRKKILLLDEFSTDGNSSCAQSLLPLLESQSYEKRFGRTALPNNDKDGDLYFKVDSGLMSIKTRFACVIASMKDMHKSRSKIVEALITRCITVRYKLSEDELEAVLDGKKLMRFDKCGIKKPFDARISLDDYKQIRECVKSYPNIDKNKAYLRTVGDCCRAFAILGKHDFNTYFMITKLHQEA